MVRTNKGPLTVILDIVTITGLIGIGLSFAALIGRYGTADETGIAALVSIGIAALAKRLADAAEKNYEKKRNSKASRRNRPIR